VIVGITYIDPSGQPENQMQYYGLVTEASRDRGVLIECHGAYAGEICGLPPATTGFVEAKPGTYRLRATGEEVTDPDYLTTWTLQRPAKD